MKQTNLSDVTDQQTSPETRDGAHGGAPVIYTQITNAKVFREPKVAQEQQQRRFQHSRHEQLTFERRFDLRLGFHCHQMRRN